MVVAAAGASANARNSARPSETSAQKLAKIRTADLSSIVINYLPCQGAVREFYGNDIIQRAVAGLIVCNFLVSATKAQCCLEGEGADIFYILEVIFNSAFTIELFVNMYGYFWCPFWKNAWNVFDFIIVVISDASMFLNDVPGISSLRLLRAFRVVRLFKRVPALKLIIEGVLASLPGVMSAFAVLFLITCIWSIMATDFFRSTRPEQFGNFFYSTLTFFQVMTYDSWYSGVAGSLIKENGVWVAGFFLVFVFANSIIMMNVVTAILLERFIAAVNASLEKAALEAQVAKEALQTEAFSVSVKMTLNIYYDKLGAKDKNKLKDKIRDILANTAEVHQDAVSVTLTKGSLKVEAEIKASSATSAESIEKSMNTNNISQEVLEAANSIPGVKSAIDRGGVTGAELKVEGLEVKRRSKAEDEDDDEIDGMLSSPRDEVIRIGCPHIDGKSPEIEDVSPGRPFASRIHTPKLIHFKDAQARDKAMKKMKRQVGSLLGELDRNLFLAVAQLKALNLEEATPPSRPGSATNGKSLRKLPNSGTGDISLQNKVRPQSAPGQDHAAAETVKIALRPRPDSGSALRSCKEPMTVTTRESLEACKGSNGEGWNDENACSPPRLPGEMPQIAAGSNGEGWNDVKACPPKTNAEASTRRDIPEATQSDKPGVQVPSIVLRPNESSEDTTESPSLPNRYDASIYTIGCSKTSLWDSKDLEIWVDVTARLAYDKVISCGPGSISQALELIDQRWAVAEPHVPKECHAGVHEVLDEIKLKVINAPLDVTSNRYK